MAALKTRSVRTPKAIRPTRKVVKTYRLSPTTISSIRSLRKTMDAKSDTEVLETMVAMEIFRKELAEGAKECFGLDIAYPEEA